MNLHFFQGESHQALLTLQRGFAEHYASDSESKGKEQRLERAKVMLLEAKLMEESSSYDPNIVLRKYKEVSFLNNAGICFLWGTIPSRILEEQTVKFLDLELCCFSA